LKPGSDFAFDKPPGIGHTKKTIENGNSAKADSAPIGLKQRTPNDWSKTEALQTKY